MSTQIPSPRTPTTAVEQSHGDKDMHQMNGKNIYELNGVHKHFGKGVDSVHALAGVDLDIADGEFLAIQGPTGQGKSTLLLLLGGLDRPSAGSIRFDGRDLATLSERELVELRGSAFGFVFQSFNLIPTLTAKENVETALVPARTPSHERQQRARELLGELGLGDRAEHLPSELSGGQQQRVAIARALVKNPKVLLADEPTGNLDEEMRDEIVALLERLWRERGLTLITVTHDSSVARRAQRIAVITGGRVGLGAPQQAVEVSADGLDLALVAH
ncbi:MAG TPA: ABC transporter ATP-binding protein [Solirubrobacteraceae bacterium]|jgi:putative ABC transport system ATP-binding protein|nr:ABC transporter ATP-binding protein [Solirubrobacteraceae bacterium]